MNRLDIENWMKGLQDRICDGLTKLDGGEARFREDNWSRPEGGGGRTRTLGGGAVIEKGGVAFSAVHGPASPIMLRVLQVPDDGQPKEFFATGVSLVIHPRSPMVPIIHMNVRYFELSGGIWWFGGGVDVTPHYVDKKLAKDFHTDLKNLCDKFSPDYYTRFKEWSDDYFYLTHRKESRGISGLFFDRLGMLPNSTETVSKETYWPFVQAVGDAFVSLYAHQVNATRDLPYGEAESNWQRLRRGRYVEYNLIHDRGTKFGLETNGRTESILMSMPPQADWVYDHHPAEGSREAETLQLLAKGIDWLNI